MLMLVRIRLTRLLLLLFSMLFHFSKAKTQEVDFFPRFFKNLASSWFKLNQELNKLTSKRKRSKTKREVARSCFVDKNSRKNNIKIKK